MLSHVTSGLCITFVKESMDLFESDTMTMPLLLSEILQMDELMGSEHTSTLVQWLSSVYNGN